MKDNLKAILIIFFISLFAMLPMFLNSYKSSHDTKFHLANIVSLTETIKENIIPSKIVPNIANNFGYGIGLFYPPLAHFFIAYTNILLDNPITSIKIFYFIILFSSGITMYFLSKKISNSWEIGLVSATIYMLFPYHLSNIYIRDAQNEALLFVFLPIIISGLYELYKNNNIKKFYILFITGYVGGMLSHLTMMVYFTFIILLIMLLNLKKTIKNIKPLLVSSFFILTITSFFLIPLLEQKIFGNYRVFMDGVMVEGTFNHALIFFDYFNCINTLKTNDIKYFIDIITLFMLILSLIKYKKLNNKFYNCLLIFGIISLVLSSKLIPWDLLPKSFRIMQFPWRFETFVALSVSLISPLCLKLLKNKTILSFIICSSILLFVYPTLNQATDEVIDLNNIEYFYGLGAQEEYLPVKMYDNKEYFDNRSEDIIIISGNGNVEEKNKTNLKLEFNISGEVVVEFPRIYYVGYKLKDIYNNEYEIYENENGFIEANLKEGKYILEYSNNTYLVSIISILGGFLLWKRK